MPEGGFFKTRNGKNLFSGALRGKSRKKLKKSKKTDLTRLKNECILGDRLPGECSFGPLPQTGLIEKL